MLDRLGPARAACELSLAIRKLVADDPKNETFTRDLGTAWDNLANIRAVSREWAESKSARWQAADLFRKLVVASPSRSLYRNDLARTQFNLGTAHLNLGEPAPGGQRAREAAGCSAWSRSHWSAASRSASASRRSVSQARRRQSVPLAIPQMIWPERNSTSAPPHLILVNRRRRPTRSARRRTSGIYSRKSHRRPRVCPQPGKRAVPRCRRPNGESVNRRRPTTRWQKPARRRSDLANQFPGVPDNAQAS